MLDTKSPQVVPYTRALLNAQDVARVLGISVEALYRWRSMGMPTPKAIRIGRTLRWTPEAVDDFIRAHQEQN